MILLVEVVKIEWIDLVKVEMIFDLLLGVGKILVMVEKDVFGFIGNWF